MEPLPLPGGEAAVRIPQSQPLYHAGHLGQVAAFQTQHIFPVAPIPVGGHIHFNVGDRGNDTVSLSAVHHRAHADLFAVRGGDHDQHPADGNFEQIVFPYHAVHLFAYDAVYDTGTMHRMNNFIPYLKHESTSTKTEK